MAGGRLQERIRAWVAARTAARGERARLAAHLQRQRGWVTKYVNRQVDADVDTIAAIAAYFEVAVPALLEGAVPPAAARDDAGVRQLVALWQRVPPRERPLLLGIIELYARAGAATRSTRGRAPARAATTTKSRRRR